ncbi:HlyD family secretion protein [Acidocella sp.]|uniref:efflux RND transporter periplasmic adaptor subunit n=1 Tax=Acidocella sp. TaxID=50710 RepID=UPI002612BD0F|nr:HlyD family secretion protein [Acidocella sp.]
MPSASFVWRFLVTLVALAIAVFVAWQLWVYYMDSPWTRDGRVRADIVSLAPDVSGPIVRVFVHDNQPVHSGEKLFQIDPSRFNLALEQANAALAQAAATKSKAQATLQNAEQNAARYAALSSNAASAVSRDDADTQSRVAQADYAAAQADYAAAQVNLNVAQLNLRRTTVRATVNGVVTNFSMRPGDYVVAGNPVIAIVDTDSLYVDGYFEETKLRHIQIGDKAEVQLLQGGPPIDGHVQGFAAGIADRERIAAPTLLADVNPTFTWVRLAARIPVRIAIDHVPAGTHLIAGMTATVTILPNKKRNQT